MRQFGAPAMMALSTIFSLKYWEMSERNSPNHSERAASGSSSIARSITAGSMVGFKIEWLACKTKHLGTLDAEVLAVHVVEMPAPGMRG